MVLRGIEPRSRPRQGRVLAIGQQDLENYEDEKYLNIMIGFSDYETSQDFDFFGSCLNRALFHQFSV